MASVVTISIKDEICQGLRKNLILIKIPNKQIEGIFLQNEIISFPLPTTKSQSLYVKKCIFE